MNCDDRGSFTELLKTADHGQFSVNISKPGITKGQHWHNTKWEFFIVVAGHGLIQERKIGTDEVERDPSDPDIRIVSHIKNSLETSGGDIRFEIRSQTGFRWLEIVRQNRSLAANSSSKVLLFESKQQEAAYWISEMLKSEDVASKELLLFLTKKGISEKTARLVKEELGIKAYRKNRQWYWTLKKEDSNKASKEDRKQSRDNRRKQEQ